MVKPGGIVGEVLEGVKDEVGQFIETGAKQVTPPKSSGQGQQQKTDQSVAKQSQKDVTQAFVKDLYATQSPSLTPPEIEKRSLADEQKKKELRQILHNEYYQKLVNPPKQQEERPAEKVEREKMGELQEEQEKQAKKPPPLPPSARPGTVERKMGVSG